MAQEAKIAKRTGDNPLKKGTWNRCNAPAAARPPIKAAPKNNKRKCLAPIRSMIGAPKSHSRNTSTPARKIRSNKLLVRYVNG